MSTTALNSSGVWSRTSTPIRAITSNLAARTAPSIPPASQSYEPLVKSVLRRRLTRSIFLYSSVLCWGLTVAWRSWGQAFCALDFLLMPVLPSTLLFAGASWVIGALPVLVLRKVFLTANHASAASPSKTLQIALSKRSTLYSLLVYTSSAGLLTLIHTLLAYTDEDMDPRLTIFVKSRKHPYYLNGRLFFLVFSQMTLAGLFLLRSIMMDRFVFRWSPSSDPLRQYTKWPFSIPDLIKISLTITAFVLFSLTLSAVFFALGRIIVLPMLFKLPLLHYVLRPFTAHFLRGSWTLFLPVMHTSLLFRAFLLGLSTVATWEWADVLFDSFISQPTKVAKSTANPTLTLISGVSSSHIHFRYFAYAELKQLAMDDSPAASAQRTALFGDQKYNPTMWSTLVREGLVLLGRDYQLLLRRGKPEGKPAPAPVVATANTHKQTPSTPLIKKPIFKPTTQSPIRSVLDSFAADGIVSQAVADTAEAGASHIPELFRSVESIVRPMTTPAVEAKRVEVKGLVKMGRQVVGAHVRPPLWAKEVMDVWGVWWRKERLGKVVEGCLPLRNLDTLVVEVLSHLTCASLTEDRYGVVQRDIPRILEAFLSFLSAVEEYQMEINARYVHPTPEQLLQLSVKELEERESLRVEVEKAGDALGVVADALKEGVVRIVRTFGNKLLAFKFAPMTAAKLQGFVDYN